MLINGAGGAVGGYAVQLAKGADAHVIATAGPRSSEAVKSAGADEVIDHTTTGVTAAVTEPVDVVLNLAPVDPAELAALVTLVRPGGVVVNTTVWMPAPADEERGVRGIDLFVRSDADQLSRLVALIDRGELRVDVAERCRWRSCRRCTPGPPKARCTARSSSSRLSPDADPPPKGKAMALSLDPEIAEALAPMAGAMADATPPAVGTSRRGAPCGSRSSVLRERPNRSRPT